MTFGVVCSADQKSICISTWWKSAVNLCPYRLQNSPDNELSSSMNEHLLCHWSVTNCLRLGTYKSRNVFLTVLEARSPWSRCCRLSIWWGLSSYFIEGEGSFIRPLIPFMRVYLYDLITSKRLCLLTPSGLSFNIWTLDRPQHLEISFDCSQASKMIFSD
jgi:hypothetical protein